MMNFQIETYVRVLYASQWDRCVFFFALLLVVKIKTIKTPVFKCLGTSFK